MINGKEKIIVPQLPKWSALKTYVKVIDNEHVYSNFGSLNIQFMSRLEKHWCNQVKVFTTSSGTTALMGAILAQSQPQKSIRNICILPSYTFVGTISAVISCGYTPYLLDINLSTWDIEIGEIKGLSFFDKIGLIVPVSIYGKNVDIDKWEYFSEKYSIPVVIDAAASFDTLSCQYLSKLKYCTICVSFHATKVFGTGEGGVIIVSCQNDADQFFRTINFGFFNSRESIGESINGKMSEYHAAVGLAELDNWNNKLKKLLTIKDQYKNLALQYDIERYILCGEPISLSYCFYLNHTFNSYLNIFSEFEKSKIDCRLWYGKGIQSHPAYKNVKHSSLSNTFLLSEKLIGIPMHLFLKRKEIESIIIRIKEISK